jgi:hypothetical protein
MIPFILSLLFWQSSIRRDVISNFLRRYTIIGFSFYISPHFRSPLNSIITGNDHISSTGSSVHLPQFLMDFCAIPSSRYSKAIFSFPGYDFGNHSVKPFSEKNEEKD